MSNQHKRYVEALSREYHAGNWRKEREERANHITDDETKENYRKFLEAQERERQRRQAELEARQQRQYAEEQRFQQDAVSAAVPPQNTVNNRHESQAAQTIGNLNQYTAPAKTAGYDLTKFTEDKQTVDAAKASLYNAEAREAVKDTLGQRQHIPTGYERFMGEGRTGNGVFGKFKEWLKDDTAYSNEEALKLAESSVNRLSPAAQSRLVDYVNATKDVQGATLGNISAGMYGGNNDVIYNRMLNKQTEIEEDLIKNYHISKEDLPKLAQYQEYLMDKESTEKMREQTKEDMKNPGYALAGEAFDWLSNGAAGALAFTETLKKKTGNYADPMMPINTNSDLYALQNINDATYEGIHENLANKYGNVAAGAYTVGHVTGENLVNAFIAGSAGEMAGAAGASAKTTAAVRDFVALAPFAPGAFSEAVKDGQERGLTENETMALAGVYGAAEVITEKLPLDHLFDIIERTGKRGAKQVIVDTLMQAGIEGGEEVAADVIDRVADMLISGDRSEYETAVREYMEAGKSEEEAKRLATQDFLWQVGADFAVGAASGGISGGVGNVVNYANRVENAKEGLGEANYAEIAQSIDTDESHYGSKKDAEVAKQAKEYAERLAKKTESGKKIKNSDILNMWELMNKVAENAAKIETEETSTKFIPKEYREETTVSPDEAVKSFSEAQTAAELAEAHRDMENSISMSENEKQQAEKAYEIQRQRLISEGKTTTDALKAEESRPTKAQAYEMGLEGKELDTDDIALKEANRSGQVQRKKNEANQTVTAEAVTKAKATDKEGKEYTVTGLKRENGEVYYQTESGDVPASQLTFDDESTQNFYNDAVAQPANYQQAYMEYYPGNMPLASYQTAFNRFKNAGRLGVLSFDEVKKQSSLMVKAIGEDAARKIYEIGQNEKKTDERPETKKKTRKAKGRVIDNRENKDTSDPIYTLAKAMASRIGQDIELTDSDMENVRGTFSQSAAKIILNTKSDMAWQTFFHEGMGEFTEAWNTEGMREVQDAILKWFIETNGQDDLDERIKNYQRAYEKKEGTKSYRDAANEFVNDALAGLFSTDEGIEDFANWLYKNETKSQADSILQRLANFIQELVDTLKSYIRENAGMGAASKQTMQMEAKRAEELRARILDAVEQATQNYENAEKTEEIDGAERYSLDEVEPIKPTSDRWKYGVTFAEALRMQPNLFDTEGMTESSANGTQITGTVATYRKIYDILKNEGFNGTILDASSGKGLGTKAGIEEYGFNVEDIEPYPGEGYKPKYADYSKLNKKYDVIISNAVLNVMPQDQRDALVVKMGQMLKEGGRMFINVRGNDVLNSKGKVAFNEDNMEYYIPGSRSYQKGFSVGELTAYLQDALGNGYTVETAKGQNKFGGVAVIVTKNETSDTKHSIEVLEDGTEYVKLDGNLYDDGKGGRLTDRQAYDKLVNEVGFIVLDGQEVKFINALPGGKSIKDELFRRRPAYKKGETIDKKGVNEKINENIVELLTASKMVPFGANNPDTNGKHAKYTIQSFDNRTVRMADDKEAYRLDLTIAILQDGTKVAYAKKYVEKDPILKIKIEEEAVGNSRRDSTSNYNIPQNSKNATPKTTKAESKGAHSLDIEYEDALQEADTAKMRQIIRQAARKAGYDSPLLYHGTMDFGFTKIDLDKMDDKISFFATDKLSIASSYSGTLKTRGITEDGKIKTEDIVDALEEPGRWKDIREFKEGDTESRYEYLEERFDRMSKFVKEHEKEMYDRGLMEEYRDFANTLFEQIMFRNVDDKLLNKKLRPLREAHYVISDYAWDIHNALLLLRREGLSRNVYTLDGIAKTEEDVRDYLPAEYQGTYELYGKLDNMLEIDGKGDNWNNIRVETEKKTYTPQELIDMMKERNMFKNVSYSEETGMFSYNGYEQNKAFVERMLGVDQSHQSKYESLSTREIAQRAKDQGYAGVIIKNITDDGGKNNAFNHYPERGNIYIFFDPQRQVKSADPITYDENGEVIPPSERFNEENGDLRFALDMPIEESEDLIAVHNITPDEMMKTLELGGFPMPSIAITRYSMGHSMYGSVSVLFRKGTIDPKGSRANKVYSGDAYTPEFPQLGYKVDGDRIAKIRDHVKEIMGDYYDMFNYMGLDEDNFADKIVRNGGDVVGAYENNEGLKYAFTKDKGIDIEVPTRESRLSDYYENDEVKYIALMFTPESALKAYQDSGSYKEFEKDGTLQKILDKINAFEKKTYGKMYDKLHTTEIEYYRFDQLMNAIVKYYREGVKQEIDRLAYSNAINDAINEHRAEYEHWLKDLFEGAILKAGIRNNRDMFTPSGNRRGWDSLHDEFNLANIVKAMKSEDATGKGFGGYSFFGSVNREFDSIEDIHSEEDRLRLIDKKEYEDAKQEIADELFDIAKRLNPSAGYDAYSIMSDIAEAIAKRKTKTGVKNFLSEWYDVSEKDVEDIMALAKRAQELPTGYFEAKPRRAVNLDEIASVVVPDLETELIDALDERNIPYVTYKAGDEEARKEAVNSVPDIRFALEGVDEDVFIDLFDPMDSFTGEDAKEDPYRALKDAESSMRTILSSVNDTMKGQKVDEATIRKIAKEIIDYTNSSISERMVTDNLYKVFDWMQNSSQVDYRDAIKYIAQTMSPVISESKSMDPAEVQRYENFKNTVLKYDLKLSPAQKKEMAAIYGNWQEAFGKAGGKLRINDKGMPLDGNAWMEIVDAAAKNGFILDMDASDAAQPVLIMEALEAMKPQAQNNFGGNQDEASMDLAMRVFEHYFKAEAEAIRNNARREMLSDTEAGRAAQKALKAGAEQIRMESQKYKEAVKAAFDKKLAEKEEQIRKLQKANRELQQGNEIWYKKVKELSEGQIKQQAAKQARYKSVEAYKEAQERIRQRVLINKIGMDMINRLLYPTDKKHIPDVLKQPTAEFLSSINFISNRAKAGSDNTLKWRDKMNALADALSKITKEDADFDATGLASLIDPELVDKMHTFATEHESAVRLSELSSEAFKELAKIMRSLSAIMNKSNEFFSNKHYESIDKCGWETIDVLDGKKTQKDFGKVKQSLYNIANVDMLEPYTYFAEMGKAPKSIYEELRDGRDLKTQHIKETGEFMEELMKGVDAKTWTGPTATVHEFHISNEGTGDGETTIRMTEAQIMSLYESMPRQQAKHHIAIGGMKVEDFETKTGILKKVTLKNTRPVHITPLEYDEIISVLSKEQIRIADAMQEYMANVCAKWGNRVTRELYGYSKFTEKDYFPIKVDSNTIATTDKNDRGNQSYNAIRNMSASKTLTPKANNALIVRDIFDVFTDHVVDMATYDGFCLPLSDALRWFNFKEKTTRDEVTGFETDEENPEKGVKIQTTNSVKEQISRVYGNHMVDYFKNLIKDINGEKSGGYSTALDRFMGSYKAAAVGANLRVVIQQPMAYVRAADVIDQKYLIKALGSILKAKKYSKEAIEKVPLAWWKSQGYFETSLGKSMRGMITGIESARDKIDDITAYGAQKADDLTLGMIYHAVQLEVADKMGVTKGEDFDEAVRQRATEVYDLTQVIDTTLNKSQFIRDPKDFVRMATAFMNEPIKSYNMMHRGFMSDYEGKTRKAFGKAVAVFVVNNLFVAAAQSFIDAFRTDDDERDWLERFFDAMFGYSTIKDPEASVGEKIKAGVFANLVDDLNPLNLFPYFKEVSSILQGYDSSRMDTAWMATMYQAFKADADLLTGSGKKTPYGVIKANANAISRITGLPVYNVLRELETIYNNISDTNLKVSVKSDYEYLYDAVRTDKNIEIEVAKLRDKKIEDYVKDGMSEEEARKNTRKYMGSALTKKYKDQLIELYKTDKVAAGELKQKLIRVYMEIGFTRDETNEKINKWIDE